MGAVDVGIYAQTLSLLLERNTAFNPVCRRAGTVSGARQKALNIPDKPRHPVRDEASGYADDHPADSVRTGSVELSEKGGGCAVFSA